MWNYYQLLRKAQWSPHHRQSQTEETKLKTRTKGAMTGWQQKKGTVQIQGQELVTNKHPWEQGNLKTKVINLPQIGLLLSSCSKSKDWFPPITLSGSAMQQYAKPGSYWNFSLTKSLSSCRRLLSEWRGAAAHSVGWGNRSTGIACLRMKGSPRSFLAEFEGQHSL